MRATESQMAVARAKRAYDAAVAECKAKGEWPTVAGVVRDGNGRIVIDARDYVATDYAGAAKAAGYLTPLQYCKAHGIVAPKATSVRVTWK